MKNKLPFMLALLVFLISGSTLSLAQSEVYGVVNSGAAEGLYKYTISSGGISDIELIQSLTGSTISGGFLVDTKYYYSTYAANNQGYQADGIYCYDIEEKVSNQIVDWGFQQQGPCCASWAYDFQTGTMYAGNGFQGGGGSLLTVDLETGALNVIGVFELDRQPDWATTQAAISAIAMDYDGNMYGAGYWGGLYKIDKNTAQCTYIGPMTGLPANATNGQIALQYQGACDLFYDNNTDKLYLTMYQHPYYGGIGSGYGLYEIDPKTGAATYLQETTAETNFTGNSIPFTIAEASAPQKVQNFTVTRGENGALSATLDWDNPSKTYGRGGTLESLDSVVVFRNGVKVNKVDNPVIGGHVTWTDSDIAERGVYSYKVVPYNDMGMGDRTTISLFIGPGDPLPVTNVTVTPDDQNAIISWTAPTAGKIDSWIDTTDLTYDVTRQPDGTQVGTALKETTFTDTTIPSIGKYSYEIVAHAGGYTSDKTTTGSFVLGPPIIPPATIGFENYDQFNLWTVYDLNGNNSIWAYNEYFGSYPNYYKGATITYAYDNLAAADMLISPYLQLEAGKHYKMTFNAVTRAKSIPESLAITFGTSNDYAKQDSITQFDIVPTADYQLNQLRANLPVVETNGAYYVGFYYRSFMAAGYGINIHNVQIAEDHEGYIVGKVTDTNGNPVENALLLINGGQFVAHSDAMGNYHIDYLPEGTYNIDVQALGFYAQTVSASVTELETTTLDITLNQLPTYAVKGVVKDVAGDAVKGADVQISGYNNYTTTTDAEGKFEVPAVYLNDYYSIYIYKNKYLPLQQNFSVNGETDLGDLTLDDNIKAPRKVTATESDDKQNVTVAWQSPSNDPRYVINDDGAATTFVGIQNAGNNAMLGVIDRTPSTLYGVQFYLGATAQVTNHYSVYLRVFDLDENGLPTDVLYENTYVPVTDDAWTNYTLPAPIEAPNGYYVAISHYSFAGLGIDGGADPEGYPLKLKTNCFTNDYTTGNWFFLEGQSENLRRNFMMRPYAAPYEVEEDMNNANLFIFDIASNQDEAPELLAIPATKETAAPAETGIKKTVQDRVRYNVYRFGTADLNNQENWTLLEENTAALSFDDTAWGGLDAGSYYYGVKAVYTGDKHSETTMADSIGNKMIAKVTFRIKTNTPENEAFGAKVFMINGGGRHVYQAIADEDGVITFDDVWKTGYDVTISLDGFISQSAHYEFIDNDEYDFDIQLLENQIKPYNLVIDDTELANSKNFIWNYPDYFFEGFEDHNDFDVNSAGPLGWQYIDGDGGETGGIGGFSWPNIFQPMAYIVFNPNSDYAKNEDGTPITSYYYNMSGHSGQKFLTDWAAYEVQNDDWIITPKLHFQQDFKFGFWAKSLDYNYMESFRVWYSTTTPDKESFQMLQDSTIVYSYFSGQFSYNIPKEAKYVAIQCISDQKRVFILDDIEFGIPSSGVNEYRPAWAPRRMSKAPSLEGAYEVYLDGEKVADTDDTEYLFENLSEGNHTAGVIASYTSGKTEMSTIDFVIEEGAGIATTATNALRIAVDGRRLTISGNYEQVAIYGVNGAAEACNRISGNVYNLSALPAGVYFIKVSTTKGVKTMKVTLK